MAEAANYYQTIPELMAAAATNFGDAIAIKEDDLILSFKELDALRVQAAKSLISLGIKKGDKIAIWAPNVHEWIIAALATHTLGAVLIPMNTRDKGAEAAWKLNASGAKVLFSIEAFAAGSSEIRYFDLLAGEQLETITTQIALRGSSDGVVDWAAFMALGQDVSDEAVSACADAVEADDIMDMLFTSGTTGKPKGVLCAHAQNIRTVTTWADTNGLNADDNYLVINPFFHSFGYKAGWLACLIKGAKILPVLSFDLDAVLQQIQDDKISMLPGPPTIYQSILVHPRRKEYDLSSLRLAVTGAAPVPVELVNKMRNELNFESVVTAYGLTETCGFVSICRPDDPAEIISNSSGRAMDGVEVKIVANAEGQEAVRGEAGEIWVRGYNVMKGYFNNEAATAEAISADGWLKTGDIGVMDANGYIDITDRMKDMYISGGFNVYPAEIENGLSSLEGVSQVAVIGVPDERMGEVGKAYIVKVPGANLSEAEVIAWSKTNMANYKVPKLVEFIEAMPLNASGKILKTELRKN